MPTILGVVVIAALAIADLVVSPVRERRRPRARDVDLTGARPQSNSKLPGRRIR